MLHHRSDGVMLAGYFQTITLVLTAGTVEAFGLEINANAPAPCDSG